MFKTECLRYERRNGLRWAERNLPRMSFCWKLWAAAAILSVPLSGFAATCTTQAELSTQDRDLLASAAMRVAGAVAQQDAATLQSMLLPSEASAWPGIHNAADQAAPLLAGGQIQIRNLYLLDASMQTTAANTDFFCADKSGGLNVTISMPSLPPGKYAVALADASGAKLAGQLGLILGQDGSTWKLAGLAAHQGVFDGHDGVWYWTRGRALAHADPWSAWYSYDAAHYLLIPIDFLSSPNLDKLHQEQSQIGSSPDSSPEKAFPLSLAQGDRTWKIDAIILNPALHEPDLAVVYESTGVTDPAALRTEATSVLSALLKAQPGLRSNFHGLWAIAVNNGQRTPVMELPMAQIP
jgi:hypothetical protein